VLRCTVFLVVVMTAKADSGSETECCTSDLNLRSLRFHGQSHKGMNVEIAV
jgi:hypothetical protein